MPRQPSHDSAKTKIHKRIFRLSSKLLHQTRRLPNQRNQIVNIISEHEHATIPAIHSHNIFLVKTVLFKFLNSIICNFMVISSYTTANQPIAIGLGFSAFIICHNVSGKRIRRIEPCSRGFDASTEWLRSARIDSTTTPASRAMSSPAATSQRLRFSSQ